MAMSMKTTHKSQLKGNGNEEEEETPKSTFWAKNRHRRIWSKKEIRIIDGKRRIINIFKYFYFTFIASIPNC
jgi:hypothetical protein